LSFFLRAQVKLSTVMVEVGLPYEEAEALVEENKRQLETFGSRIRVADVGFYVRRVPKDQLGTGKDFICLVTGARPQCLVALGHLL
jgi:hypothetical protein